MSLRHPAAEALPPSRDENRNDVFFLSATGDGERDLVAGFLRVCERGKGLEKPFHRLAVNRRDQVVDLQAGLDRRAFLVDLGDEHAPDGILAGEAGIEKAAEAAT